MDVIPFTNYELFGGSPDKIVMALYDMYYK